MTVAMTTVEVICPTAEELMEKPRRNVPCTVEGCDKLLATTTALKMHVIKTHGIYKNKSERVLFSKSRQSKDPVVQKHYFCPVVGCSRHQEGNNPFPTMWPLKQHYQQVHGERKHLCRNCHFPFAFELQRRKHEKICGKLFTCSCGVPYTTRQALFMHAMRKNHQLPSRSLEEVPEERQPPEQQVISKTSPVPKSHNGNTNPSEVAVNRILTIPVPVSQAGTVPRIIVTPQPLQIAEAGTLTKTPQSRNRQKTQRFLLPKPTILSISKAAVLHPESTQIVTINRGIVKSFPVSDVPSQPAKMYKRTLATQTPQRFGNRGLRSADCNRERVRRGPANNPLLLAGGDGSSNSLQVLRDSGMSTLLNTSSHCQTQTIIQQNSAHTQTPGDVIMQEALMLAQIEMPARRQQQQQQQQQQLNLRGPEQQVLQQLYPEQDVPALNRHTQGSQTQYQGSLGSLPNNVRSVNSLPGPQNCFSVQTEPRFSNTTTSNCDVQTDNWLSSLAPVSDQGTLTDIAGVPTQTDLNVFDFLNLSSSETQTIISQSAFDDSAVTESTSTQTTRLPTDSTHTSIHTATSDLQSQYVDRLAPQSTMETQTNFYGDYLDAFLLNESQSQTSPGGHPDTSDTASCCQQTQTLSTPAPQTDHQQTQTALPDLSLSSSDFLSLDMYTQTIQQGHGGNQNSSLQTQTDSFLEYSLSSMQTQTMADFDLGAFDYQSTSVQTDANFQDGSVRQLTNRTQVHTQTSSSWQLEGGDSSARHVQTDATHQGGV